MFKVMKQRCDQCLYGKNKIVSNQRRAEIIREITRKDCHFICHKTDDVCCRGDFDQRGGGQLARIAGRLNMIEFVDVPESKDAA
jgi:hypothetical protein